MWLKKTTGETCASDLEHPRTDIYDQPAIAWYIGVFGKPLDPFVLTPEPAVSAPPLAFEWLVAIWLFVTAKFVFAALVIFCAWFGFQRLLDIYENQFEVSNKATK